MKKLIIFLLVAAVLITAATPALATDIFVSQIDFAEIGGVPTITKTYLLSPSDDPTAISTNEFERNGYIYKFTDLIYKPSENTESKLYSKTVKLPSYTRNMSDVLNLLSPDLDVTTEDGFSGSIILDHTTIIVDTNGYKTTSYNISATRTYPNLSAADVALVPKSIEDNGNNLSLDNVNWQESAFSDIDGYSERYTATVTYTGTASKKIATGYTITAEYSGTVTKTTPGPVEYNAIFEGSPIPVPEPVTNPFKDYQLIIIISALSLIAITLILITILIKKKRRTT